MHEAAERPPPGGQCFLLPLWMSPPVRRCLAVTSSECVGLDVLSFPLVPSSVALVACFVEAISDPGFFGRELKLNQIKILPRKGHL